MNVLLPVRVLTKICMMKIDGWDGWRDGFGVLEDGVEEL